MERFMSVRIILLLASFFNIIIKRHNEPGMIQIGGFKDGTLGPALSLSLDRRIFACLAQFISSAKRCKLSYCFVEKKKT